MLISVTAPKKGMGQTITAINLGTMITKLIEEKILFVDINRHYKDIELYLSDTHITKGLDDFCSLYHSGLLSQEAFNFCVKNIDDHIEIMGACECFEMNPEEVEVLTQYIKNSHNMAVIDTISGNHALSKAFFKQSDILVVVINQMKNLIDSLSQHHVYRQHHDKIIFVLNKYIDKMQGNQVTYSFDQIQRDLKRQGFNRPVFTLDFDIELINECNDQAVLNFVMANSTSSYIKQLNDLAAYILKGGNDEEPLDKKTAEAPKKWFNIIPGCSRKTALMEE
ncbi:MAG: hypothetical protein MJB12_00320 [Firmicutes bacterium]|nr:hypothetical protein [Bacillota bacterium]